MEFKVSLHNFKDTEKTRTNDDKDDFFTVKTKSLNKMRVTCFVQSTRPQADNNSQQGHKQIIAVNKATSR